MRGGVGPDHVRRREARGCRMSRHQRGGGGPEQRGGDVVPMCSVTVRTGISEAEVALISELL